jgi:AraC-like DNA-binding protein
MKMYLDQVPIWHCLIIDSRCSFAYDFFQFIKELPFWIPVILLIDSLTEEFMHTHGLYVNKKGCIILKSDSNYPKKKIITGEKLIIECSLKSYKQLFPILQFQSIRRKLLIKMPDEQVFESMKILFERNPISVEEWSAHMNLTPRKFQRMFKNYTKYSPKKLITLYHAYRIAFSTMQRFEDFGRGVISAYILDEHSKKRVMEYVLTRRSQLLSI